MSLFSIGLIPDFIKQFEFTGSDESPVTKQNIKVVDTSPFFAFPLSKIFHLFIVWI